MTSFQDGIKENLRRYQKSKESDKCCQAANGSTSSSNNGSSSSPADVKPEELRELILDGKTFKSLITEDADYFKQFCNLEKLSCNRTGLQSLKGFPLFDKLRVLELADNRISGDLELLLDICPNVRTLILGGNKIASFDQLQPLVKLRSLKFLDLELTKVSEEAEYKSELWKLLPNLDALDGVDQNGKEVMEEEVEGCEEDEDDESEDEDGDEYDEDTTLKDFYSKDYVEGEDENDEGEFCPTGEIDDEDIDEEDEDVDEEPEDDTSMKSPEKRKSEAPDTDLIVEKKAKPAE